MKVNDVKKLKDINEIKLKDIYINESCLFNYGIEEKNILYIGYHCSFIC
jgi:hypothetical protein